MQMNYFFNFIILLSLIFLVVNCFSIFIGDDGRELNKELKSELSTYKNERDLIFDMNETLRGGNYFNSNERFICRKLCKGKT